jgi:hypothetical protein
MAAELKEPRRGNFFRGPLDDYLAGLGGLANHVGIGGWLVAFGAATFSWWIYVPFHELAHAYGCILTGGEVSRLEIDPLYGAELLSRVFPFVAVGSEYAGQLTGFDTRGSDLIYLATDLAPFLLTILVGVPLLRCSAFWPRRPALRAAVFGAAIPVAFAPFISWLGDYYEMASLLVSRLAHNWSAAIPLERWRGDDFLLLAGELWRGDGTVIDAVGLAVGLVLGTLGIFATYGLGRACSRAIEARVRRSSGRAAAKVSEADTSV